MSFKRSSLFCVLLIIVLSACADEKADRSNLQINESSPTAQSTSTETPQIPANTPQDTATLIPTETLASILLDTSTPEATAVTCINRAEFVRHLSFSDNSSVPSGIYFGKAWRIKNSGTCTWTSGYNFVFAGGEQMNAPAETPLSHDVLPGENLDIQILMRSPEVAHDYFGNWVLRDSDGNLFGSGDLGDQPFSIKIVVKVVNSNNKIDPSDCG